MPTELLQRVLKIDGGNSAKKWKLVEALFAERFPGFMDEIWHIEMLADKEAI